jgi:hypothetical protein
MKSPFVSMSAFIYKNSAADNCSNKNMGQNQQQQNKQLQVENSKSQNAYS